MNPQRVLKVDRWFGRPICWALTVVRRVITPLVGWGREQTPGVPPKKILFIKMIEQGATVLAYAALRRAVEMVGRENVYFWVFEENRPILDLLEIIPGENVLVIRTKRMWVFGLDILRTLWRIRRLGIDATVDMEFFSRAPAILAWLTGARRRVGLHRFTSEAPYRGDLLTHRVQYNPYIHTAGTYHLLVEALLADPREVPLMKQVPPTVDLRPAQFQAREEEREKVAALVTKLAPAYGDGPLLLLNSNASDLMPLRKWPTERFVELARRLLEWDASATIVFTGGPSEASAAEKVVREISSRRVVSMAGKTTLRELLVLFTLADVLVTNDSGPGHFASLTGIDAVVLFGPETPALYGPVGPHTHVVTAGLACSPCVNVLNHRFSPCGDNRCMQMIGVEQVYQTVVGVVAERRKNMQVTVNVGAQVAGAR
jgi:ADP-heptose:LPS heptosyltransferase